MSCNISCCIFLSQSRIIISYCLLVFREMIAICGMAFVAVVVYVVLSGGRGRGEVRIRLNYCTALAT